MKKVEELKAGDKFIVTKIHESDVYRNNISRFVGKECISIDMKKWKYEQPKDTWYGSCTIGKEQHTFHSVDIDIIN